MTPHWVGMIGTGLVVVAFLFLIGVLLRQRKAGALSFGATVLNMTASLSLLGYAILRQDNMFIFVMGFQLAAVLVILVLKIHYQNPAA